MQDQVPENSNPIQRHGGFKPGVSGNPKGKPKGARNRTTVMCEKLMAADAKAIVTVVTEAAKGGDLTAAKIVLDKLMPQAKSRRVAFPMAEIESLADVAEAYAGLWRAVSSGTLTIDEGIQLGNLLNQNAEMLRSHDLERRIERLENDRRHRI